jgi:antirestriction protein ArdC
LGAALGQFSRAGRASRNASSGRAYSGINILILWHALFEGEFAAQRWLTFKQAEALGGHVRKGERGVTVCYADRFTPKDARGGDGGAAGGSTGVDAGASSGGGDEVRQVAFLKRFTVFNVAQCDDLPGHLYEAEGSEQRADLVTIPEAEALIVASGANISIGAPHACYMPRADRIEVPSQAAFIEPINYYRTVLHELGHWTGHGSRLDRDQTGRFGTPSYGREELVAEMCSAFSCAALGIVPTVRHADYIACWLEVLKGDNRAIFGRPVRPARRLISCWLSGPVPMLRLTRERWHERGGHGREARSRWACWWRAFGSSRRCGGRLH